MSIAGWMRSQLQRSVDDAARRMHARLVEAGFGPVQPPRMTAPLVFAVGVLAVIAAAVVGMVWATAHATGVVAWVLVVIGWLVLAALLIPRPVPLPDDVTVLDRSTTPHPHQVVAHLAAAVGTPTPERIGVDTSFNAYVGRFGWRGKDTLVLGLPFWAASTWDERLGVMGHELGHLAGRDTAQGRLKYATSSILRRTVSMMLDAGPVDPLREVLRSPSEDLTVSFEGRVTRAVLRVLAIPPFLALLAFERLAANDGQYREYLADRRAALAAGSAGLASSLSVDVVGLHTAAAAAVRRGEDPFALLAERAVRRQSDPASVVPAPVPTHRWDATHPPTELRIDLLTRLGSTPGTARPSAGVLSAVQAEMQSMQVRLARQVCDDLLDQTYTH